MGIDGDIRRFFEMAAGECFYPQLHAFTGEYAYPDTRAYTAFVDDLNSLTRSLGLAHPGVDHPKPWHCRLWGDVFRTVGIIYNERFAAGMFEGRVTLDCNTPPNKGKAQASRGAVAGKRKDKQATSDKKKRARVLDEDGQPLAMGDESPDTMEHIDPKANYYQWPKEEDGSTWFLATTEIQCSWEEIFYSDDPRPKMRFMEALTRYILYELPLPHECSLLMDCGVINGKWERRPMRVSIHHPFRNDSITAEQLQLAAEQGLVKRRIVFDDAHKETFGYGEADDRIIYHVYDLTVRCRKSVAVFSGDGDTDVALVATRSVRSQLQRNGPPEYRLQPGEKFPSVVHAMRRSRKLLLPDGRSRDVCDTIVIDTDRLAVFVDCHYGGGAILAQGNALLPRTVDATAVFALLVSMRATDYTEDYPYLSAANLFEAFEKHRDVLVEALETRVVAYEDVLGPYRLLDCLIHVDRFIKFITLASNVARTNGSRACRAPSTEPQTNAAAAKRGDPPNDKDKIMTTAGVTAMAMRCVWLVDKYVNGGLPGYELPDPFTKDPESGKSLYGYARVYNPKSKREEVVFTMDVHQRPVAHIVRI